MEDFVQELKKSKPKDVHINFYKDNLMKVIKLTDKPEATSKSKFTGFWGKFNFKVAFAIGLPVLIIVAATLIVLQNGIIVPTPLTALRVMAEASKAYALDPTKKQFLESSYQVTTNNGGSTSKYTINVNSLLDTDNGYIDISQTNDITNKLVGKATYPLTKDYFKYDTTDNENVDLYSFYTDGSTTCSMAGSVERLAVCVNGVNYIQFYPQYDLSNIDRHVTDQEATKQDLYLSGFRQIDATTANKIIFGDLNPKIMDDQSKAESLIYKLIMSFTDFRIDRAKLLTDIQNSPAFTFEGLTQYKNTSAYKAVLNTNLRKVEIYIDADTFVILGLTEYDHSISDTSPLAEMQITKYIINNWNGFSTNISTTADGYLSTTYDNKDYSMIQELQKKIDAANKLMETDNDFYASYIGTADTKVTTVTVVDNIQKVITIKGEKNSILINDKFENGKLIDMDTNTQIKIGDYNQPVSSDYIDYLPTVYNAAQYVLSDLNGFSTYEGDLATLGVSSQRKVTDSTGGTTYSFKAKFSEGTTSSILNFIFEQVKADWMTIDGSYTYGFDSRGRVISVNIPFANIMFSYND